MITLLDVIQQTGGRLLGGFANENVQIPAICTDTRKCNEPAMFVPYKGNHVDAHDLIGEAFNLGCIGTLTEHQFETYRDDRFYVLVDNVVEALWKIIQLKRKRMKTKLICVTGSVGKSTTTSFVANVLRKKYNVFETLENRNDIFSCPAVFYKITDENEFAVIELGCGEHSSASKMSWMLNPDYIVLTQIGHAHIGKFGSIEAICTEKCGTQNGLKDGGIVFANGNDAYQSKYPFKHSTIWYGKDDLRWKDKGVFENHKLQAALAAKQVWRYFGFSDDEIFDALNNAKMPEGRMDAVECINYTLIDSSFNACIESMDMAFQTLNKYSGKKVVVLGEMLQTGCFAEEAHEQLGKHVPLVNQVVFVGAHYENVHCGLKKVIEFYGTPSLEDGMKKVLEIASTLQKGDAILVKGSHGSGVHKIAEKLMERRGYSGEAY